MNYAWLERALAWHRDGIARHAAALAELEAVRVEDAAALRLARRRCLAARAVMQARGFVLLRLAFPVARTMHGAALLWYRVNLAGFAFWLVAIFTPRGPRQ